MNVQLNPDILSGLNSDSSKKEKEEAAMAFEKLFARQLVQEMTKGLFEADDNKPMVGAGSGMYRDHIVDTLSHELAKQRKLGMADQITEYINAKTSNNK